MKIAKRINKVSTILRTEFPNEDFTKKKTKHSWYLWGDRNKF